MANMLPGEILIGTLNNVIEAQSKPNSFPHAEWGYRGFFANTLRNWIPLTESRTSLRKGSLWLTNARLAFVPDDNPVDLRRWHSSDDICGSMTMQLRITRYTVDSDTAQHRSSIPFLPQWLDSVTLSTSRFVRDRLADLRTDSWDASRLIRHTLEARDAPQPCHACFEIWTRDNQYKRFYVTQPPNNFSIFIRMWMHYAMVDRWQRLPAVDVTFLLDDNEVTCYLMPQIERHWTHCFNQTVAEQWQLEHHQSVLFHLDSDPAFLWPLQDEQLILLFETYFNWNRQRLDQQRVQRQDDDPFDAALDARPSSHWQGLVSGWNWLLVCRKFIRTIKRLQEAAQSYSHCCIVTENVHLGRFLSHLCAVLELQPKLLHWHWPSLIYQSLVEPPPLGILPVHASSVHHETQNPRDNVIVDVLTARENSENIWFIWVALMLHVLATAQDSTGKRIISDTALIDCWCALHDGLLKWNADEKNCGIWHWLQHRFTENVLVSGKVTLNETHCAFNAFWQQETRMDFNEKSSENRKTVLLDMSLSEACEFIKKL